MGLFDAFKAIKGVMSGEVVQQIDTPVSGGMTTMSLRLKKQTDTNAYYVVLAGVSGRKYQYFYFAREEFAEFSLAIDTIRDSLMRGALARS
jgi:hypothetical protein